MRALPWLALAALAVRSGGPPDRDYLVLVASEAADRIAVVRFGPAGARVERDFPTGVMPDDIDGPHGLAVSPDGRFYFVSFAHGQPFGSVWKYATDTHAVQGRVTLGMFPATMQVSPSGDFLYVVNFNLHGDRVPSSVSVVDTTGMSEIARIPTCVMPHGSRFTPDGARHYSACMMDDTLVEIDTAALKVSRRLRLGDAPTDAHAGHGVEAPPPGSAACSPTWAQPSADGRSVFVACNGTSEILEVDAGAWAVKRRIAAGPGVYNLAVTNDGRLVATNRRGQSVSVYDLASGRELARVPTPRRVVHGVTVAPDDRYAFVSIEGVAAEPGTVMAIDLQTLTAVGAVDVAPQAGGIDFWKIEPARR